MPLFQHSSLSSTSHRPYPLSARPWVMSMVWHDLLFMHWAVDPQQMRTALPDSLEPDLFEGSAWLGVVPFRMTRVRPRCLPAMPANIVRPNPSSFLELNVRTYVKLGDKPGVFFFSLDAESKTAVRLARRYVHLPYFDAQMTCDSSGEGWFDYQSHRTHADAPAASCSVRYRPLDRSKPRPAAEGTLEYFLTERYCLYVVDRKQRPLRGEIHHEPWPLQAAEAQIQQLEMTPGLEFALDTSPLHCHFAKRLHVAAWMNRAASERV